MTRARRTEPGLAREAFALPLLFLTVTLAGGLRVAESGALAFAPPPLMALVLAVMLVGTLYRGEALVPDLLVHGTRDPLANVSGVVVLVTLFAAAAQLLNTLTPEGGLLAFSYNVVFLVLLGNTLVTRPDRPRLLGSLMVTFGAAFVVKYVVLSAVYASNGGLTKRVVLALLEGVSLGGLAYAPPGPVTGYVAFGAALLFLIGLVLLPVRQPPVESALVLTTVSQPPRALDLDDR
jgi:hypothetical protein